MRRLVARGAACLIAVALQSVYPLFRALFGSLKTNEERMANV